MPASLSHLHAGMGALIATARGFACGPACTLRCEPALPRHGRPFARVFNSDVYEDWMNPGRRRRSPHRRPAAVARIRHPTALVLPANSVRRSPAKGKAYAPLG